MKIHELQKKFVAYLEKNIFDNFPVTIYHLPESGWAFFLSSLYNHSSWVPDKVADVLLVAVFPEKSLALQVYEETRLYLPREKLYLFFEHETLPYEWSVLDLEVESHRLRTMEALLEKKSGILFTTARALTGKLPSRKLWKNVAITLKKQEKINREELARRLVSFGYRHQEKVENKGEFAIKGSIIDIFAINSFLPVRIDLFDEEIESLRYFDPETQRSLGFLEETRILFSSELLLSREEFLALKTKLLELPEDLRKPDWLFLETQDEFYNNRDYPGLLTLSGFLTPMEPLWNYISSPSFWIFFYEDQLKKQAASLIREFQAFYENSRTEKVLLPPGEMVVLHQDWLSFPDAIKVDVYFNLEDINKQNYAQNFLQNTEKFSGKVTEFKSRIESLLQDRAKVFISASNPAQYERITFLFRNENLPFREAERIDEDTAPDGITLLITPYEKGFSVPSEKFYFFTDSDIFGKAYSKKFRVSSKHVSPLESFLDLKEGEYVVHVQHGIGRFLRLEKIKAGGQERECLVIEYADQDILYVPLSQISLIQRYLSPVENPKLDHLGKASFKKIRERVEKNIEEFARELLEIYASRLEAKGFAFPPDTELQEKFEAEFPYEETPDQIRAIEAVKRDMESERPMDRLICGDVGYGKTEVAIRAVFKCVEGGKQAAIICPTTILARQHFLTFSSRFKNYPVKIDWISSLRTAAENQQVKKQLKEGNIDVIIGTHALLADDVIIPNLGLLVIDEEQRFGVVHKEKLKKIKRTIDVLTLTATPIPRTLHMSLIGIRDLSVINTPPRDRKPVITYVLEYSEEILKDAIIKEIQRGGQVFYLHNHIGSLEYVAGKIHSLIPDIRIAILHSKMSDYDIDRILCDFIDQKYNLLLTTTIIENGIDIPNVNTLIVDNADRFGLSQLYQIRGRVGRSHRQAYAYFFHGGKSSLTEEAQKRLNTLLEYQELGSGFKIAMRDLEIRGAGNILGKEQSGDIIEVGYELYIKLLDNAIKKLRGEKAEMDFRCHVSFSFDFYLSETYIPDTRQRIEFYKKFDSCKTVEQFYDVVAELKDRFGEPDEVSRIYITLEEIRTLGTELGIESITENRGEIEIKPSSRFQIPLQEMLKILQKGDGFYLKPGVTQYFYLDSLRLKYLKEKKLNYRDVKILLTGEDLQHLIQKLYELLDIKNKKKPEGKDTEKKQKTIAR